MKKILPLLLATLALLCGSACDNKRDMNGPFDGMWQLLSWQDKAGRPLTDAPRDIYYCVQLKLIKFMNKNKHLNYHLAYFTRTPDSLVLGKIVHYPTDTVCQTDVLKPLGVPANGRFCVKELTDERMVLTTDQAVLTFRKY